MGHDCRTPEEGEHDGDWTCPECGQVWNRNYEEFSHDDGTWAGAEEWYEPRKRVS